MKILCIGDPHFKVSNVKEMDDMCKRIYKYIESESIDLIVVMGDTLDQHEHIHVVPLVQATNFLTKLSTYAKTYLLIGNHDRPNNSDFLSIYHPFTSLNNNPNLIIVDKVISDVIQNMKFIFVPYVYPGRFKEALSTLYKDSQNLQLNDVKCIFAHQEFYGTKMGAMVSTVGDKWSENDPFVISGHIHDYCRPQDNIIYVGTPLQHAFGDRDDKTISLFEINPEGIPKEKRIDLGMIKRVIHRVKCEDLSKWIPPENYLIKLIIEGSSSEIKAIMKMDYIKVLMKKRIKIVYDNLDEIHNHSIKVNLGTTQAPFAESLRKGLRSGELLWYTKIF